MERTRPSEYPDGEVDPGVVGERDALRVEGRLQRRVMLWVEFAVAKLSKNAGLTNGS